MKRLDSIENGQVELEVVECDCGFHLGVDATYLIQVGDFQLPCPSCGTVIDTQIVFPEHYNHTLPLAEALKLQNNIDNA